MSGMLLLEHHGFVASHRVVQAFRSFDFRATDAPIVTLFFDAESALSPRLGTARIHRAEDHQWNDV